MRRRSNALPMPRTGAERDRALVIDSGSARRVAEACRDCGVGFVDPREALRASRLVPLDATRRAGGKEAKRPSRCDAIGQQCEPHEGGREAASNAQAAGEFTRLRSAPSLKSRRSTERMIRRCYDERRDWATVRLPRRRAHRRSNLQNLEDSRWSQRSSSATPTEAGTFRVVLATEQMRRGRMRRRTQTTDGNTNDLQCAS